MCLLRPVSNFNLILLEDNKQIWSRFRCQCWAIEKNKSDAFNFYSGNENTCTSNNIEKSCMSLNSESSIIVTSNNFKYFKQQFLYYIILILI